jgi:hypothetical protein
MSDQEQPDQVSGQRARAGATPRMTRYILGISLPLVIVVFFLIWALH